MPRLLSRRLFITIVCAPTVLAVQAFAAEESALTVADCSGQIKLSQMASNSDEFTVQATFEKDTLSAALQAELRNTATSQGYQAQVAMAGEVSFAGVVAGNYVLCPSDRNAALSEVRASVESTDYATPVVSTVGAVGGVVAAVAFSGGGSGGNSSVTSEPVAVVQQPGTVSSSGKSSGSGKKDIVSECASCKAGTRAAEDCLNDELPPPVSPFQ